MATSVDLDQFGFFNYVSGDDDTYRYTAEEFSTILSQIAGDGVNYKYSYRFNYTLSDHTIGIYGGGCWIAGHYGYTTSGKTLTMPSGTTILKCTVAVHLDTTNRKMELVLVQGDATDYPTLDSTYLPLFNFRRNADDTVQMVNDLRTYNYGSSNYPSAQIIVSATEPTVTVGAIWLKPVS